MEFARGVRVHAGGYGERIAWRASRRPLRGGLRPVLTDSRLTPTPRSADEPVKGWLRRLCPLLAGVSGSVRSTASACGGFIGLRPLNPPRTPDVSGNAPQPSTAGCPVG